MFKSFRNTVSSLFASSEPKRLSNSDYSQFKFSHELSRLLATASSNGGLSVASYAKYYLRKNYLSATEQDGIRLVFDNSFVTKMELAQYKLPSKRQHEFVVATVEIPARGSNPPGKIYVRIERELVRGSVYRRHQLPPSKAAWNKSRDSIPDSNQSSDFVATEMIKFSLNPFRIDTQECDKITYDFSQGLCLPCKDSLEQTCRHRLSLFTLVAIVELINSKYNEYRLVENESYWYAAMVVEVGRHLSMALGADAQCDLTEYSGLPVYNKEKAVVFVKDMYQEMQQKTLAWLNEVQTSDETRVRQAGLKAAAKAEEELVAAAEARAELEKKLREAAEAARDKAEAARDIAEAARDIAEANKQRAEAARDIAEANKQRAEANKQRAEANKQRAEAIKQEAEETARELSDELARLKAELADTLSGSRR